MRLISGLRSHNVVSLPIGGTALVKGARHKANAQKYYHWLMSPAAMERGLQGV